MSRILRGFWCGGTYKAVAYKRRQAEKHRNYAVLGRFGLLVFAYDDSYLDWTGRAFVKDRGAYYNDRPLFYRQCRRKGPYKAQKSAHK